MLVPDLVFFHFYSVEVQSPWDSVPIFQGGFLLFLEISPRHQSSWQWSQPSHQFRCVKLLLILTTDKGYLPHSQFLHTAGSSVEHNLLISHPTDLTLKWLYQVSFRLLTLHSELRSPRQPTPRLNRKHQCHRLSSPTTILWEVLLSNNFLWDTIFITDGGS